MSCFSCLPFKSRKPSVIEPKETTLIEPKETPLVASDGPNFKEFWEEWIIKPLQFDLQLPKALPESNDTTIGTTNTLCKQCMHIVSSSGLLTGSRETFTQRFEWHNWYEFLRDVQVSSEKRCHLCTIFWSSIPKVKRLAFIAFEKKHLGKDLADPLDESKPDDGPISVHVESGDRVRQFLQLRVKLWIGSSGSHKTGEDYFMQLYRRQDKLSKRLKISFNHDEARPIELSFSTRSPDSVLFAKGWLDRCREEHTHCPDPEELSEPPTRLICVDGSADQQELRLYIPSKDEADIKYLALSHCWGAAKIEYVLTEDNYDELCKKIDFERLTKNFKDAICFTREMGFKYVWIDSLCIKQGSAEDWAQEAGRMSTVYTQAACTISSSGSATSEGGLYHDQNFLSRYPCVLLSTNSGSFTVKAVTDVITHSQAVEAEIDAGPLGKRAWAFQERLLSTHIAHFGASLLFFECNTLSASFLKPEGSRYSKEGAALSLHDRRLKPKDLTYTGNHKEFLDIAQMMEQGIKPKFTHGTRVHSPRLIRVENPAYKAEKKRQEKYEADMKRYLKSTSSHSFVVYRIALGTLKEAPHPEEGRDLNGRLQLRLHQCWYKLVEMYTNCQLTQATDRLVAIQGVSNSILGDQDESHYQSGLWTRNGLFDLLWCAYGTPGERPEPYRAPSWSWGSVDGNVGQRVLPLTEGNNNKELNIHLLAEDLEFVGPDLDHLPQGQKTLIEHPFVDIKCRLLHGTSPANNRITFDGHKPYTAELIPDISFKRSGQSLYGAEILIVIDPADADMVDEKLLSVEIWGLVLRIAHDSAAACEGRECSSGERACYERVGVFKYKVFMERSKFVLFSDYGSGDERVTEYDGPFSFQSPKEIRII